jgi:sporulation protein YlmC with PRC-barrel domain
MLIKRLVATTALSLVLAIPTVGFANAASNTAPAARIDSGKLLNADVDNTQGKSIGEVEGVLLDKSGQTQAVVIDVGGFLGVGEHRVALNWDDLTVSDNGRKVTSKFTKEQLKAMPEYKYPDQKARYTAFHDPSWMPVRSTAMTPTTNDRLASADWTRVSGEMKATKLLGADVRGTKDEDIGEVKDALVDRNGKIQALVVDVGGFLGMGSRHVALDFAKLQYSHKGDDLRLTTAMTKEQLKGLPEYDETLASADGMSRTSSGGGRTTTKSTTTKY